MTSQSSPRHLPEETWVQILGHCFPSLFDDFKLSIEVEGARLVGLELLDEVGRFRPRTTRFGMSRDSDWERSKGRRGKKLVRTIPVQLLRVNLFFHKEGLRVLYNRIQLISYRFYEFLHFPDCLMSLGDARCFIKELYLTMTPCKRGLECLAASLWQLPSLALLRVGVFPEDKSFYLPGVNPTGVETFRISRYEHNGALRKAIGLLAPFLQGNLEKLILHVCSTRNPRRYLQSRNLGAPTDFTIQEMEDIAKERSWKCQISLLVEDQFGRCDRRLNVDPPRGADYLFTEAVRIDSESQAQGAPTNQPPKDAETDGSKDKEQSPDVKESRD